MARLLLLSRRHSKREGQSCDVCNTYRVRVAAKLLVEQPSNCVILHRFAICRSCLLEAAKGASGGGRA